MIGSTTPVAGCGMPPAAGGKPPGPPPGMEAAAKALGLDDEELRQRLRSGSTLADIASEQGVSRDDLVAAVAKGIEATAPAGADATSMAQQLVDGKLPPRPPHARPPHADGDGAFAELLQTVSSLSGTDESELLSKLQSGTSFGDLLEQSGLSWQDVRSSLAPNDGVGLDGYA